MRDDTGGGAHGRPGRVPTAAGRVLLALGTLVVAWLGLAAAAQADVAPTGAFETSVAIKVPLFHGLEPRLGLAYSSSAPNAWMGVGWSLQGLSTIRRQSSGRGVPQWDASDTFTLDGQDLMACPPPKPNDNSPLARSPSCAHRLAGLSAYTTRVESFQRIAVDGDPIDRTVGDERWLVWRTDGVIAAYAPGLSTSHGVLEWRLTQVKDLSGNTVSYDWGPSQGEQVGVLRAIRYGDVEIRFQTEQRPDPIRVATGAGLVTSGTRLQVIDELAGGRRIRAYALRYRPQDRQQPSRQSFLQSVQQYGSDAVVTSSGVDGPTRLPATTFDTSPQGSAAAWASRTTATVADWAADWPTGPEDSTRFASTLNGRGQDPVPWPQPRKTNAQWATVDLNGDQRTDFVLITPAPDHWYNLQIEFAQPGGGYRGFFQQVAWPAKVQPFNAATPLVGDVNGDGISDLTLLAVGPNTATVFGQNNPGTLAVNSFPRRLSPGGSSDLLMGDVTGDGLADLVAIKNGSPACSVAVQAEIGTGSGYFDTDHTHPICLPANPRVWPPPSADFQLADVNGDLKADVVGFQPASTNPINNVPTAEIFTAVGDGTGGFRTHVQDTGQVWAETTDVEMHREPWCPPYINCDVVAVTEVRPFRLDVDGDGRSDLVVLRPGPNGKADAWTALSRGDGFYREPTAGTTPFDNVDLESLSICEPDECTDLPPPRWLGADFDGDGAGDLGIVTGGDRDHPNPSIRRALSDRRGNWTATPATTRDWSADCPNTTCWDPEMLATTGDINGDGRDDVLFAHTSGAANAFHLALSALDADPTPPTPAAAQILTGDVNADGRQDLLYPTMTPAGVQVRVLQQRADHTYQRIDPVTVPLNAIHLAQHSWLVADVNCDRRADLVNLDRSVTALLSHGDHDWQASHPLALSLAGRWSVADINGDECDDLALVGRLGTRTATGDTPAPIYGVLALFAQPDGTWREERSTSSGVPDSALADTLNWHAADIDGNRKTDLVHVDSRNGRIDTLLRRDGGWQPIVDGVATSPTPPPQSGCPAADSNKVILTTDGDDPAWKGLDVNADGAIDLARVRVNGASSILVETLLSHGNGHYSPRTSVAGWAQGGPEAGADSQHWTPADLDHDGRGDLVRVFSRYDGVIIQAALSNGGDCWTEANWTDDAATQPATSTWQIGDWQSSGHTSAVRLDATTAGLTVSGYDSTASPDRLTRTTNGLGTSTSIDYAAGTSMLNADATTPSSCRLPTGSSATPVVAKLATSDTPTGSSDASTIRYACPRYSSQLRGLVAWRQTWTTHQAAVNRPASTEQVVREVFRSGIVQPILDEVTDANGRRLRATESAYQMVSDDPKDEPQLDLLTSTAVRQCADQNCATSTVDNITHDEFGNITSEFDRAAGSGRQRRTDTFYLHDHDRWLQTLPRLTRIVDPSHPNRLLRASLTCYDGDTSADCDQLPPRARGLATLTRAWDDTTGSYLVTGQARHDQFGNRTATIDANHHTTTTYFDPQLHLHPIQVCNARRQCTRQPEPWDRRADAPLQVIDPNRAVTRIRYDPLGRPATTVRPSHAVDTVTYYTDGAAGTTTQTITRAAGVTLWTRTFADGLGRPYLVERPGGNGRRVVQTTTRYSDASTRPYRSAAPLFTGDPPVWETTRYDAAGRPVRQTHADGTATTRRYFVRNGLAGVETRDEVGRLQTYLSDGWGALVAAQQPSATSGRVATTRYTYDAVGDLVRVTDPAGNSIRADFDSLGRKSAEHDPDRGTTRYRYDPVGNLRQQADARGRVLVYYYDNLNRRTRKRDLTTHATSSWHYDEQPGHGAAIGRLTSVRDRSATGCPQTTSRSLTYNLTGNLIRETRCIRGAARTFRSRYDPLARLHTLSYPDGEQLTYTYDAAGHLFGVSGYLRAMRYNAADQLATADYSNRTQGRWDYSRSRGWLDAQTLLGPAGRPRFDIGYRHDPSGLVTAARSQSNHTSERYDYDGLGRLTTVTGTWHQRLGYDFRGNLTSNSHLGTYSYPAHRRCVGPAGQQTCAGPHAVTGAGAGSYQYDAVGNMTVERDHRRITRRFTWDSDGLLSHLDDARVGRIANLYDADGTRVQQTTRAGTTKFYSNLADWTAKTGLTKYIYAGSLLIARHQGTQRHWYTLDRLGSPRLITDHAGRAITRASYAPYGQTIGPAGQADPIGYTGHRPVGDTDLIDMLARDYNPRLARMLSADTIIPDPTNPQALNRYSYAYNNPITFTDPSGHANGEPDKSTENTTDDLYRFLWTSEMFSEIGARALNLTQLTAPDVLVSTEDREAAWLQTIPIPTPSSSTSTTPGTATDTERDGSGDVGVEAAEAPQPSDQIPQTGVAAETKASGESSESDLQGTITVEPGEITGLYTPFGVIPVKERGTLQALFPQNRNQSIYLVCGGDPACTLAQSYPWDLLHASLEVLAWDALSRPLQLIPLMGEGTVLSLQGGMAGATSETALLNTARGNLLTGAKNSKLRNLIDQMYRRNAQTGSGSTADAIRHELRTGELLSRSGHPIKGQLMRAALYDLIKSGTLNAGDRQIAAYLLSDLQRALSGL